MGSSNSKEIQNHITDLTIKNNNLQNDIVSLQKEIKHLKSIHFKKFDEKTPNNITTPITNIVFEGGGIKGLAYCGAMIRLNELGLINKLNKYAGSSVGAISATLLAIGYSPEELLKIIKETDFNNFMDDKFGYIRDFYNLMNDYGYCKGDYIYDWIGKLIQKKTGSADYTFGQLYSTKNIQLVITGTNLTTLKTVYYSHCSHENMKIRDAVRISMSIPFLFRPIEWNNETFVDGGVIDNYPLHVFDGECPGDVSALQHICEPNWNTLGLKLMSSEEEQTYDLFSSKCKITDVKSFAYSIMNILCKAVEQKHVTNDYWLRSVVINSGDIGTTQFNLTTEQKNFLINEGKKGVDKFIEYRENIKTELKNKK